jgi:hypothetical protein
LAIYLILKAVIFISDIASLFDFVGGVVLLLTLSHTLPDYVLYVVAALVGLKGIMSLFA